MPEISPPPFRNTAVDFNRAFLYLMLWEDSHPSGKITKDAGGLTRFGISSKAYPELNIEKLTLEAAQEIYKKDYWDLTWEGPSFSQALANKHFQIKVNLGAEGYRELMQVVSKVIEIAGMNNLCLAQLMHYKERYKGLNNVPEGLVRRALG